jgi:hypothetical protein
MCGTVGNGAEDPLVRGMFRSLVVMVSMPFSVVGAVSGWLYYRVRRGEPGADAAAAEAAGEKSVTDPGPKAAS